MVQVTVKMHPIQLLDTEALLIKHYCLVPSQSWLGVISPLSLSHHAAIDTLLHITYFTFVYLYTFLGISYYLLVVPYYCPAWERLIDTCGT